MSKVKIDSNPSEAVLNDLGVANWPTWEKEVSTFPWEFTTTETAFILEGECVITPNDDSEAVTFTVGDLVVFPKSLICTWEVKESLKKHYQHS